MHIYMYIHIHIYVYLYTYIIRCIFMSKIGKSTGHTRLTALSPEMNELGALSIKFSRPILYPVA